MRSNTFNVAAEGQEIARISSERFEQIRVFENDMKWIIVDCFTHFDSPNIQPASRLLKFAKEQGVSVFFLDEKSGREIKQGNVIV